MSKITEFQSKVYEAVKLIPKGRVTTYKGIAQYIGCDSCQAIGQALKKNPNAPEVPCHRVIKTNGEIGGYMGHRVGEELQLKFFLLSSEGIEFIDGMITNKDLIFDYSELV